MSDPKKHHYLPEAYLRRWASDGRVWRFIRPRGENHPVHCKRVSPAGVGYRHELYSYPRVKNPSDKRVIEKEFFQKIDDLGAKAIFKIEENTLPGTPQDKANLAQFLLSMAFRSPNQLTLVTKTLRSRIKDNPLFYGFDADYFRHYGLDLMQEIISSDLLIKNISELNVYIINVADIKDDLMTSDQPLLISAGLDHNYSFIALPIGPKKILMLARDKSVPESFANQSPTVLVNALNDAVCVQAEELVIGNRLEDREFIEARLQRGAENIAPHRNAVDGLVRWKPPLFTDPLPGLPRGN